MGYGGMMAYNGTVLNPSSLGYGSLAIGLTGALGSILGASANVSAIKAQSQSIVKQIEAESKSYVWEVSVIEQQRREARRELGDMMSDVGLQAVEAEATVRATNAMRGVSGSSVEQSSTEVAMKANLANADLIRQYENTDVNLLRRELARRIEFDNKTSALASGIPSSSSAFLNTLSGAVQGFGSGLSMYRTYDWFTKNT